MRWLTLSAILALLLDQVSKYGIVHGLGLIERGQIDIAPPYLVFRMGWNQGINFGLLTSSVDIMRWVLVGLALTISAWLVRYIRRHEADRSAQVFAGLIIGGAIGNAIDRVVYGAVADFLNMSCCGVSNPFVFNIADVFIFAGVFGLALFGTKRSTSG